MELEYFRRPLWDHLKMTQPDGNHDEFYVTSEVPVEHETLKSGRDVTGRDGTTTDDGRRRWKDRR